MLFEIGLCIFPVMALPVRCISPAQRPALPTSSPPSTQCLTPYTDIPAAPAPAPASATSSPTLQPSNNTPREAETAASLITILSKLIGKAHQLAAPIAYALSLSC
ncbi:hypothetical protein IQ06DRAFT_23226 [Phaeosphaeriaceae sp. SRC1lsM3a]|nr:hypothetical protein IQ06DRAFT_23226 [Stagonospora sp. SRC1lsM3a]